MTQWIVTVRGKRVGSVRAATRLIAEGRAASLFGVSYTGKINVRAA